jgi:hypothetical protein
MAGAGISILAGVLCWNGQDLCNGYASDRSEINQNTIYLK